MAPGKIQFGNVVVGKPYVNELILRAVEPVDLDAMEIEGSDRFTFDGPALPVSLRPGVPLVIPVHFLASTSGQALGTLDLRGAGWRVQVPIEAFASYLDVFVDPQPIVFGCPGLPAHYTKRISVDVSANGNTLTSVRLASGAGLAISGLPPMPYDGAGVFTFLLEADCSVFTGPDTLLVEIEARRPVRVPVE